MVKPKAEALGYLNCNCNGTANCNCNGDCNCDYSNRRSTSLQMMRRFSGEAGKEVE
jgi:hypothetical protein